MKSTTRARTRGLAITIAVSFISLSALWAHGPQPVQVVADFHAALTAQDKDKALALLLPTASIYESGGAETVTEYASHHVMGDMAFSATVGREIVEQSKQMVGDVAWIMTRYRNTGTYKDKTIDSITVETAVLHHVKEGWRIAHLHWSTRSQKKG